MGIREGLESQEIGIIRTQNQLAIQQQQAGVQVEKFNVDQPPSGGGSRGGSRTSGGARASSRGAMAQLERWFIDRRLPRGLAKWAWGLVKQGYSMDAVEAELLKRPEVKTAYPGIFRKDGSRIVSFEEYIQLSEAYRSLAAQFGFDLSREQIAKAIQGENSLEEMKVKLRAGQALRTYPQLFQSFNEIIRAENQRRAASGASLLSEIRSPSEAINFILKGADREVYDLYEAASAQTAARTAGQQISETQARRIADITPGIVDLEELTQVFEQAQNAQVELSAFGVGEPQDLFDPLKRGQVEQALRQRKAAGQDRAQQQIGLRAGRPIVQSEEEASL